MLYGNKNMYSEKHVLKTMQTLAYACPGILDQIMEWGELLTELGKKSARGLQEISDKKHLHIG